LRVFNLARSCVESTGRLAKDFVDNRIDDDDAEPASSVQHPLVDGILLFMIAHKIKTDAIKIEIHQLAACSIHL
jgi:hypothetical protein